MTSARNSKPVVIAGGGIGGVACALGLAVKGFRVVVIEQAHAFGEIGAGIQLAPNAWSALDALGVGPLVKRDAVFVERLLMMDGISGDPVIDLPLDEAFGHRYGNPYAVTLLGDAAHLMLQYLAQGAAMAMEDAVCRAWCADEGDGDFPAAFQRYQALRLVRASRVQISASLLGLLFHASGAARLVRNEIYMGGPSSGTMRRSTGSSARPTTCAAFAEHAWPDMHQRASSRFFA